MYKVLTGGDKNKMVQNRFGKKSDCFKEVKIESNQKNQGCLVA